MNKNQNDQISSSELLPGVAPGERDKASAEMEQLRRCPERSSDFDECLKCEVRFECSHYQECHYEWEATESVEDATPGNATMEAQSKDDE